MLTGELKNKVDSLWEIFWTGGLTNPLDVIEQMTYLMFIHDLDTTDNLRAKESAMLGLPFKSIFADEVQIGDRKIDGRQLKGLYSMTLTQAECTPSCRNGYSPLSRICTETRTARIPSTWGMPFSSCPHP